MKVLVTGGAGFIGSHTVDRLVERGHDVAVLDNLDPQVHGPEASTPRHLATHVHGGAVRFLRGDVTDRRALIDALGDAEAVLHLAAAVGVGQSMYEPFYYVHTNDCGTGLLLDVLAKRAAKTAKLVVASSMSLYGEGAYGCPDCGGSTGQPRTAEQLAAGHWEVLCARCGADLAPRPTPEDKPADIVSVYAATKKHQEELCVAFGRAYGIPTFALRFFNVFGPRQSLSNPYTGVAAIFLSRLLNDHPPLVFEDGEQSRDFIEVRDVARAVVLALEHPGPGVHVLNVATGKRTTVQQVADELARGLGRAIPAELVGKYRAGDVRHCFGDGTRAARVLGFRAERTLADGLPELVAWCRTESARDEVDKGVAELRDRGLLR